MVRTTQENPARGTKLPPIERRRDARVLSPEDIAKLTQGLPPAAREVLLPGVTTGLRIGELLGPQVDDLDLSGKILTIRRAVHRGEVGTPKTRGSERRIPVSDFAVQVLRCYLKDRTGNSIWLFASPSGVCSMAGT